MLRGEGTTTKNSSLGHPWFDEHLLLREMTHRVKNELASAIGFASFTATQSDNREVKVALAGVIENLYNYARVYQALQMPMDDHCVDAGSYLQELCQAIGRSKLKYKGIELVLTDFELQLRAEQCWRLGMIISELITNASRHAFGEGGGVIRIEFLQRGPAVECSVTDNGCGAKNTTTPKRIAPSKCGKTPAHFPTIMA